MVSLSLFRRKKSSPPPVPAKDSLPLPPAALEVPETPPRSASYTSIIKKYQSSSSGSLPDLLSQDKALRPPRINTEQPVVSAPTSPVSRRSEFSRQPPALYVRHSRVLSRSSTIPGGLNAMFSPLQTLRHRLRTIITDLPKELLPVVNLLNAQRLRQYAAGPLELLAEDGVTWLPADASLTGPELSLSILGTLRPRYLNIQDCNIVPSREVPGSRGLYDITILHNFENSMAVLRVRDVLDMHMWLSAMHLSKYEHTSLNVAFSAVILSLKGPQLSDIYTLLAHKKRFPRFEWCDLRLPQVSNKWLRVYLAIMPGDHKKKGRIEVYTSDKLNKKSLVLYVNDVDAVYNVYPEDHHMIDFNLIMKLEGEIFVNKAYEHMFAHDNNAASGVVTPQKVGSRAPSLTSLNSLLLPPQVTAIANESPSGTRSRSTSVNSTSSFFVNAPSPDPDAVTVTPGSPKSGQGHFFKKQSANNFVTTNYLYVMPMSHPGVLAIEIMLRNFVHIIDSFKLYGRPDHLNSDKNNPISMLFGLPALPHYCYLSTEDAYSVVAANFDTARYHNWGDRQWRECLKEYLSCKQRDGPYKGTGDINELFDSFALDGSAESVFHDDVAMSPIPQYNGRVSSPQMPAVPSKLREASDSMIQGPPFPGNDAGELGNPIEFSQEQFRYAGEEKLLPPPRAERVRSLEPIVDLPTPMDEPNTMNYFMIKDDTAVPLRL